MKCFFFIELLLGTQATWQTVTPGSGARFLGTTTRRRCGNYKILYLKFKYPEKVGMLRRKENYQLKAECFSFFFDDLIIFLSGQRYP